MTVVMKWVRSTRVSAIVPFIQLRGVIGKELTIKAKREQPPSQEKIKILSEKKKENLFRRDLCVDTVRL